MKKSINIERLELDLSNAKVGNVLPSNFDTDSNEHQTVELHLYDEEGGEGCCFGGVVTSSVRVRLSRTAIMRAVAMLKRQDDYSIKLRSEGKQP